MYVAKYLHHAFIAVCLFGYWYFAYFAFFFGMSGSLTKTEIQAALAALNDGNEDPPIAYKEEHLSGGASMAEPVAATSSQIGTGNTGVAAGHEAGSLFGKKEIYHGAMITLLF